jgi:hypothetical protein
MYLYLGISAATAVVLGLLLGSHGGAMAGIDRRFPEPKEYARLYRKPPTKNELLRLLLLFCVATACLVLAVSLSRLFQNGLWWGGSGLVVSVSSGLSCYFFVRYRRSRNQH